MEILMNEILDLVKKKMCEHGNYDREVYRQFIEESIGYFYERGKLTDDDNTEIIEAHLLDMWPHVIDTLANE
jgi:hypothetical protein